MSDCDDIELSIENKSLQEKILDEPDIQIICTDKQEQLGLGYINHNDEFDLTYSDVCISEADSYILDNDRIIQEDEAEETT